VVYWNYAIPDRLLAQLPLLPVGMEKIDPEFDSEGEWIKVIL
jgi:hypothetical protein